MLAHHYAQALLRLTHSVSTESITGILKRKGHSALLPAIIAEYDTLRSRRERYGRTTIRVAKKEALKKQESSIKSYESEMGFIMQKADIVEDPAIVGGFVIESEEFEVDASYRQKLVHLFRKMVDTVV
ncbi:MAG TPA: F0F1 ATP synthase subunit delta [Candidatus Paceibacterota bacterium]